jgi:predicted GNAT family acetyltransferase
MDELTGEQLASMFSSLQKLDLRANQLSDGAVAKFAQAFRQAAYETMDVPHTKTKHRIRGHGRTAY